MYGLGPIPRIYSVEGGGKVDFRCSKVGSITEGQKGNGCQINNHDGSGHYNGRIKVEIVFYIFERK